MLTFNPGAGQLTVTSASESIMPTGIDEHGYHGKQIDVTHLITLVVYCIRENKTPSAHIEVAYEEGIACLMAMFIS